MSDATQKPAAAAADASAPAPNPPAKATEAGAAERMVVSGSDLVVLSKPSPSGQGHEQSASAPAPATSDATPAEGKRLGPAIAHTYAAAAPKRAHYRGSVAHAVDATYGDVDPHAIVKTARGLINHVYSTGGVVALTGNAASDEASSGEAAEGDGSEGSARP